MNARLKPKKKDERPSRERILKTAGRLFSQKGYAATSVDELAAAAQTSKSSIYWHFESKEDILLELLDEASRNWIKESVAVVPAELSPLEKFDAIQKEAAERLSREKETIRLVLGMMCERSEVHPRTRAALQRIYRTYREASVRELKTTFPFLPKSVRETIATLMLAAVDGLFLHWQLDPEAVEPSQVFSEVRALLAPLLQMAERMTSPRSGTST